MLNKMMTIPLMGLALSVLSPGADANIVISEYIRGATTKDSAIELYNGLNTDYTFAANDVLRRYKANGTIIDVPLTGHTINSQDTLTFVNGASNLPPLLSATNNNLVTSGNVQIQVGEAWGLTINGIEVDIIGNKNDASWGSVMGLRRGSTQLIPTANFDVAQWQTVAATDLSDLGIVFDDTYCDQSVFGELTAAETIVHVATDGYVCANGTANRPFKTFQAAQLALRDKRQAGVISGSAAIEMADGNYPIASGIILTSADGNSQQPLIIRAQNSGQVTLSGGVDVAPHLLPLADGAFKQSLIDQTAATSIQQADLSTLNLDNSVFEAITLHGYSLEVGRNEAPTMLYSNQQKMTLARWPNSNEQMPQYLTNVSAQDYPGQVSYNDVTERGYQSAFKNDPLYTPKNSPDFVTGGGRITVDYAARIAQWNTPDEVFLDGVLGRSWEWTYNKIATINGNEITLARAELSGILKQKASHFHFENIAEELDESGEFYLDRQNKMLYVYPTGNNDVTLTTLKDTMLTINGASNVTVDGINLFAGRGNGIDVKNGDNNVIENCQIAGFGLSGVILKGNNNLVQNCAIDNVGANGVNISGGQGASIDNNNNLVSHSITAANNQAINNIIHDFAYDQKSQVPGIYLGGVGNTARGNEIYNGPHFGIMLRHATDNVVDANFVHDLPTYFKQDGGAIYFGIGKFPYMRGNQVVNNLIEDVPTNGVYVDNFSSGVLIQNNLFNHVGNHHHSFSAININGGGQNMMLENAFQNSERPIKYNAFAEKNLFGNYKSALKNAQAAFNAVGVANTDYAKYADFATFLNYTDDDHFQYQVSEAKDNITYNDSSVTIDSGAIGTGVVMPADNRWIEDDNIALDNLTTELSVIWNTVSSGFNINGPWQAAVANVVNQLPSLIGDIQHIHNGIGQNLISNGTFANGQTAPWIKMNRQGQPTILSVISDSVQGDVLFISNRVNAGHSAKFSLASVTANQTFDISARLKTTGKITFVYRYKTLTGGNRTLTTGWQDSNDNWIDYQQNFTLGTDADPSQGIEIWFKTGNSSMQSGLGDILVDNVVLQ